MSLTIQGSHSTMVLGEDGRYSYRVDGGMPQTGWVDLNEVGTAAYALDGVDVHGPSAAVVGPVVGMAMSGLIGAAGAVGMAHYNGTQLSPEAMAAGTLAGILSAYSGGVSLTLGLSGDVASAYRLGGGAVGTWLGIAVVDSIIDGWHAWYDGYGNPTTDIPHITQDTLGAFLAATGGGMYADSGGGDVGGDTLYGGPGDDTLRSYSGGDDLGTHSQWLHIA